jgi:transposase-like protein
MPKAHRSPAPSPATQPRRRPKNLRPAEARRLLVAFDRSGLSVAEFERQHNLSPNRLSWWRRRLGLTASSATPRPATASVTFLPVRVAVPAPAAPAAPTPATSVSIDLVLPDGVVVRVPPSFDAAALTRLLDVLRESRAC